MKRSKYQYDKKGRTSRKSVSKSLNNSRSVKRTLLSFVAFVFVVLTSFFLIFPELVTLLFPDLSSSSIMYFLYLISAFFSNLWVAIRNSTIIVLLGAFLLIIVLLIILYRLSPYVIIKNIEAFCQRKLFFPSYKITSILLVNSVNRDRPSSRHFLSKTDTDFCQTLILNIEHVEILIFKHDSTIGIYFILSRKGFFKKKLVKTIQKEQLFLSNLLSTYYESSNEVLTKEQTSILFQIVKKMKIKFPLDISSLNEIETDMMELIYKTIENAPYPNLALLLKVKKKEKESTKLLLQTSSFSDDIQALNYLQDATGLQKKRKVFKFNKEQIVSLDDLPKYLHLPLNYVGTTFALYSKDKITKRYVQSIVLGHNQTGASTDEVLIGVEELLYNIEIYGMIGRGKTRLVCSIIDQLISYDVPCLIFDVKGEYAATFVDEPNVEIYTIGEPHPLCINLFDTKDENDVRSTLLIIEEMMVTSNQEFSPSMKNLFETALFLTHKADERTLETFVENLLTLTKKTHHTPSLQLTLDAVLNRLNYIFNPVNFEIIGVKETTLDFDLLEQGKSIILDLSQFQRKAARPSDIFLICNLILKILYRYASNREFTNKLRYIVVLEEAINVIPNIYRTESSASLITAENNFLLGRSMGIGHLTISQMWDSVSRIVHANSSTKIVFRSGQAVDKIAMALDLQDDRSKRIQQLPIRNCFVWLDGQEQTIEMKTIDFSREPHKYSSYLQLLESKYPNSTYTNLYDSFIDMRTSLYEKLSRTNQRSKSGIKSERNKKEINSKQNSNLKSNPLRIDNKPIEQLTNRALERKKNERDDVCNTFCSSSMNKEECLNTKRVAQLVCSILVKEYSSYEIEQAILGTFNITIEELLKQILAEKKLECNDRVLHCAKRELANHMMKKSM